MNYSNCFQREALPARISEWKAEEAAAALEERLPSLSIKFVYGWTMVETLIPVEVRKGCSILEGDVPRIHYNS